MTCHIDFPKSSPTFFFPTFFVTQLVLPPLILNNSTIQPQTHLWSPITHPPQLNTANFKKIQVQIIIIYSLLPHSNASPNQNRITPQPPKLFQKGKKYFDSFDL